MQRMGKPRMEAKSSVTPDEPLSPHLSSTTDLSKEWK